MPSRAVACCLLNISEARNARVVDRVVRAAVAYPLQPSVVDTSILNVFRDEDYNRSVVTIISSSTAALKRAVIDACEAAFAAIDLRLHRGGHPRLGAVDLIPIHPLTPEVSVAECGAVACDIAETLARNVEGTSFFLFGPNPSRETSMKIKTLVERRKEVGWFGGVKTPPSFSPHLCVDFGQHPNERHGLTGVGAMPYMMNFNATISTTDLSIGKKAANAVREATGGFKGVRAMAFPHEGNVEIACNVEAVELEEGASVPEGLTPFGGGKEGRASFYHASPDAIRENIARSLKRNNASSGSDVRVLDGSAIIGFSPSRLADVAAEALDSGNPLFY